MILVITWKSGCCQLNSTLYIAKNYSFGISLHSFCNEFENTIFDKCFFNSTYHLTVLSNKNFNNLKKLYFSTKVSPSKKPRLIWIYSLGIWTKSIKFLVNFFPVVHFTQLKIPKSLINQISLNFKLKLLLVQETDLKVTLRSFFEKYILTSTLLAIRAL